MTASRKLEEELTWPVVHEANILIGKTLEFEPRIDYGVCANGGCCYAPDRKYYPSGESQKAECDRWLAENVKQYPNGWVAKDGYKTKRLEYYPNFHADWNVLMDAIKRLRDKEVSFHISTEINVSWREVWEACKRLNPE